MALAGKAKLDALLPIAKGKVGYDLSAQTEGGAEYILDQDLEDVLLDENTSYRDALKHYREIKDAELWGKERKMEDKSGLEFRLYSLEHTEKHLRGILEVVEYMDGNAVVLPLGRFNVANKDVVHHIYWLAEKIGAEII